MRKAVHSVLSVLVSGMVIVLVARSAPAYAVVVSVSSTEYSVTDVETTYTADSALLDDQPWWGNPTLAEDIEVAVGTELGTPNTPDDLAGPDFAYGVDSNETEGYNTYGGNSWGREQTVDDTVTYAVASVIPETPEPNRTVGVVIATGLGVALRSTRRRVVK